MTRYCGNRGTVFVFTEVSSVGRREGMVRHWKDRMERTVWLARYYDPALVTLLTMEDYTGFRDCVLPSPDYQATITLLSGVRLSQLMPISKVGEYVGVLDSFT
jgi:hypothetical protein